ncbi:ABC transporter substrate-binding protein [Buttiauxella warmboldiae]|uniref:ABC transporter substrate-binding protein n=1 Tax=Buttiauxella warmboldiae TaxID=82993 RepID=A0A3N5DNR0_9ENTR|nr:ABC transporter substrate-binding protein [Buttiauxella warmboldiae]RPH30205.1 ABC transporter substrate-binding protein [Buttiauxella warmboldiae]
MSLPVAVCRRILSGMIILSGITAVHADEKITLDVLYTTPGTFNSLHKELARRFTEAHPDIEVKFRNPVKGYEEAAQEILRGQITNSMPDVAFNGINQIGLFVERGIGTPLDAYIHREGGLDKLGYYPTLAKLGTWKGKQYGLPFAVSTPVLYINTDMVKAAGGDPDRLPNTWPELVKLGKAMESRAPSPVTGLYYQWEQTGNWLFQTLITSKGGHMLQPGSCKIGFNSDAGKWALQTLELFGKSGMPNLALGQARQSFVSGTVGIMADSTSYVAAAEKQIGGTFGFKTMPFPLADAKGQLPAGGNVAMVLSKDAKRQAAAWEYVKFVTGPQGQTAMASLTGYMPGNKIAVEHAELLGNFYTSHPNHTTSLKQVPVLGEWASFPGENSLKIIEVIKGHTEALVTARDTAANTLPKLVQDVNALMPAECR